MELVYLWVEKYKNIQEQGFNFSSKYICKYENNELKIINNEKYIEKFFHEVGLTTLSVIVGRNGSGKSSVFECMVAVISKIKQLLTFNFIAIFKNNNELITYTYNYQLNEFYFNNKTFTAIDYGEYENQYSIYYSNMFNTGIFDSRIENFASPRFKTFDINDKFLNQSILNFYVNANRIIEAYESKSIYMQKHGLRINELNKVYQNAKIFAELHFLKRFGKEILPFEVPKYLKISISHNKNTSSLGRYDNPIEKIEQAILGYKKSKKYEVGSFEDEFDTNLDMQLSVNESQLISLLKKCMYNDSVFELVYEDAEEFMLLYEKIGIQLFDFQWQHMSGGEESLLQLLSLLLPAIEASIDKKKEKFIIHICLDEVENNLHPKWQKELITSLLTFFNIIQRTSYIDYQKLVYIHLSIATHSPFLLSDIPKNNIIFLDKDDKGQCIVADGLTDKKETFGSNIHTLLSDGFFMNDGLMGEFAKGKINDVYDFIKKNNKQKITSKEEAQSIIDLIGEPVIQKQLQIIYDENFSNENDIEAKIRRLEIEIENLKKKQKSND